MFEMSGFWPGTSRRAGERPRTKAHASSDYAEVDGHAIVRRNLQWLHAGAGRHSSPARNVTPLRESSLTSRRGATRGSPSAFTRPMSFELSFDAMPMTGCAARSSLRQSVPVEARRGSAMRVRVVSDQLRCAHCDEIGIARIRDLYADMNAGHCVENVVDGISASRAAAVAGHAEREFGSATAMRLRRTV